MRGERKEEGWKKERGDTEKREKFGERSERKRESGREGRGAKGDGRETKWQRVERIEEKGERGQVNWRGYGRGYRGVKGRWENGWTEERGESREQREEV